MMNKSKKYKNRMIKNIILVGIILLLIISYFVSRKNKRIDSQIINNIQVEEPSSHIRGNIGSEIKLIEYSDFQCPACAATEVKISELLRKYGDLFQLEYRHFPLRNIHPNAQLGAQAAEAAGMQGKFWEMHDILFERQQEWSKSISPKRYLKEYAKIIGINVDRFMFDMESDKTKEIVDSQYNEAVDLNLPGTPSFIFNGKKIDINTFVNDNLVGDINKEG